MDQFHLYKDIEARTSGEVYLGIVGPVRSGKSTFIKRFMEMMVLPRIEDIHSREQARDELPQSSAGTIIMTSEPKFIPKNAIEIPVDPQVNVKIRCIDCVGFMVEGASGHLENGNERMVMTPWHNDPIPFTKAAEVGTEKVIKEHATIGIVMTTDGSFTDIPRANYIPAEEKAIYELKKIGKPFVILLNSNKPYSEETRLLCQSIEEKHQIQCHAVNCEQLRKQDIDAIMQSVLYEFPVSNIDLFTPHWFDVLSQKHELKTQIINTCKELINATHTIMDFRKNENRLNQNGIKKYHIETMNLSNGHIQICLELDMKYYYQMISELVKSHVESEYDLYREIKELAGLKEDFGLVANAVEEVRGKGYGMIMPKAEEVQFDEPKLIRHGNKFGVNVRSYAPSIHMILANIETEIAPIVGTEEQANDLIHYIESNSKKGSHEMWNTLVFGKSLGQLVEEGIESKIRHMTDESQSKMQETVQKIMNDSHGGVVFVIL